MPLPVVSSNPRGQRPHINEEAESHPAPVQPKKRKRARSPSKTQQEEERAALAACNDEECFLSGTISHPQLLEKAGATAATISGGAHQLTRLKN